MLIVLLTAGLCHAGCQQAPQNASDAQTSDNMAADNMEFTEVPPDESAAVSTDALPPRGGMAPAGNDAAATLSPATPAGSLPPADAARSEERRGGKECVSTFRSRGPPYNKKKKNN